MFFFGINQQSPVCPEVVVTSLISTTSLLSYASAVTGVSETGMCYHGKYAESQGFAPEIRRIAAQFLQNSVNIDKRRGVTCMCQRWKKLFFLQTLIETDLTPQEDILPTDLFSALSVHNQGVFFFYKLYFFSSLVTVRSPPVPSNILRRWLA
jgi:hypothetical protein